MANGGSQSPVSCRTSKIVAPRDEAVEFEKENWIDRLTRSSPLK
jgi:hypothetical protein